MLDRDAIAEALDSVDGVKGFSYRPDIPNEGDSWPLIERLVRVIGTNYEATWRIVVVLPSGEIDAMSWFTNKFQAIADALEAQDGYVEQIEPGVVQTELGDMDCMILTYRNEA